jgi:hypothetical protein
MAITYSNNNCNCGPYVVVDPPPGPCPTGCLKLASFSIPCFDGIIAEGDPMDMNIPLSEHNDVTACEGCDPVYTVYSFDTDILSAATIVVDGDDTSLFVEADTIDVGSTYPLYTEVIYKVTCPCSNLSNYGSVKICVKDA